MANRVGMQGTDFTLAGVDDATIESAVADAHVATLVMSLVHITGDESLLKSEYAPSGAILGDTQGGISAAAQAEIRARAVDVLKSHRDGGGGLPPAPDGDRIARMIRFMTGRDLSTDYVRFLTAELGLSGESGFDVEQFADVPATIRNDSPVLIIGAGMSGLLAAIQLARAGIPWTIVEKNPDVGGTWFENSYPGCRVDSPNHSYSYSFVENDWPQYFSDRSVLHGYFSRCADEFGLRDGIRFETEVTRAAWDEASGRWRVAVRPAGSDAPTEIIEARAVISAVGQLNRPKTPELPGLERFAGPSFHSARWDHDCDLTGKQVAVIGTGASAFQFVPRIADQAESVTIFQRTPPWCAPTPEYHDPIPDGVHWLLRHVPYYAKWFRFWNFWTTAEGLLDAVTIDPAWNENGSISEANAMLRAMLTEYAREVVGDDAELFAKVVPDYPPGGKRMLRDDGLYLRTLRRDDVQLQTSAIREIDASGVMTADGTHHAADVIIFGTGFHADKFLWPMEIVGRDGRTLSDVWDGDPTAYLGITVPGFPNLFCMYGPNTNIVVNGSIIFFSECEMRYILGCLRLIMADTRTAIDCRPDVHAAFNEQVETANAGMAWGFEGVDSWYKNDKGRVTQNWPFTLLDYWQRTRAPDPTDFDLVG